MGGVRPLPTVAAQTVGAHRVEQQHDDVGFRRLAHGLDHRFRPSPERDLFGGLARRRRDEVETEGPSTQGREIEGLRVIATRLLGMDIVLPQAHALVRRSLSIDSQAADPPFYREHAQTLGAPNELVFKGGKGELQLSLGSIQLDGDAPLGAVRNDDGALGLVEQPELPRGADLRRICLRELGDDRLDRREVGEDQILGFLRAVRLHAAVRDDDLPRPRIGGFAGVELAARAAHVRFERVHDAPGTRCLIAGRHLPTRLVG